ncbi:hypothetical protein [Helicobacter cetorum]|uniref:Lipoprotein n=1 Tax=Helicobacter cetorum (strain ATCC BAA-429 / MIT 00-7128) TaxID=182217 RepID=I0EM19_HELC0|nr:hypothetical protein [Helicobacter cetorum]AFI03988.1 hypothetical protein HCW_03545 [Helicobacter cetorum MIT 00-7128]
MKNKIAKATLGLGVLLITGCSQQIGNLGMVSLNSEGVKNQSSGVVEGKACYYKDNFIPFAYREIPLGSKSKNALDKAIANALEQSGGVGHTLVNVSISHTWSWRFFVIKHCFIVRGNVVKS